MLQKKMNRLLSILLCFAMLCGLFLPTNAASSFENSIADFPESYRVILRKLHEAHPNWVFRAMKTGINFYDAVTVEQSSNRSLVPASTNYSYIFKSHDPGDYNSASGTFIQKDGGFCNANKYAVSYYLDPRNHLNEPGIFQFEDLSFDKMFDVNAVDVVLSGTFMYNTKATYYTSTGETKTSNETYAEMIYTAGKTYNINPCYLASKIRNEIGSSPSGSVTGKNSTYPGIYNFYNIGASDGAGAITRGLAWAANSTAGTYHRPWTTPKKSIVGGAEFLAATYIAKGQFTSYLQRFNVNPESSYRMYEHQYMTNVCGAAVQSYSSYFTYLSNGLLDNPFIFSIPVFEGMSGANDNSGKLTLADAKNQTASVSVSSNINVRSGPSTNHDKLDLTLAPGTKVTILDSSLTDSQYFESILRYPNWYQISFKYNGTTYKGYVPCSFLSIETSVSVPLGEYTPKASGAAGLSYRFVSLNPSIVTVVNDTKLNFIAKGKATVLAYDSTGRFAILNYNCNGSGTVQPTQTTAIPTAPNPTTSVPAPTATAPQPTTAPAPAVAAVSVVRQTAATANSASISWDAVPGATGYRVYLQNQNGKFITLLNTKQTSCTITGLSSGARAVIKVKTFLKKNGTTYWSAATAAFTAVTTPSAPTGLKQNGSSSGSVTLRWNASPGATSYQVLRFDESTGTFQQAVETAEATCSLSTLSPNTSYRFQVRALTKAGSLTLQSAVSGECTARTGPAIVTGVKYGGVTETGYTLKWNAVPGAAGYKIFRIEPDTYAYTLVGKSSKNSYKVKNLTPGKIDVYVVKAFSKINTSVYYGDNSEEHLAVTCPGQVTKLKQSSTTSSSYVLSWTGVDNASGYCVYRVNGEKQKKIASVTKTKTKLTDLKANTKTQYRVRAYIRSDGKVLWGAYSDVFTAHTVK